FPEPEVTPQAAGPGPAAQATEKAPTGFFGSLKHAVPFAPLRGAKVPAPRAARLAGQGFAGHWIPFEVSGAPPSPPRRRPPFFLYAQVFDAPSGRPWACRSCENVPPAALKGCFFCLSGRFSLF